jgi:hypothetical protein
MPQPPTPSSSFYQSPIRCVTCICITRQRLGKHIPAEAKMGNNRTSVARQRISKQASTIERLSFLHGPCRGVIKEQRRSCEFLLTEVERVQLKSSFIVENWVEFWIFQLKMIEKKWQEMN